VSLRVQGITRVGDFTLDIDIEVGSETVAIVGDNGVGKTTLLRVVAGLQPLVSGQAVLGGSSLDDPAGGVFVEPQDRDVALLFQDALLFPHLNVVDNVAFGLRRRGGEVSVARAIALDLLGRFGVLDLAERRVDTLSGGQAQRVALARALAVEPRVILLDEPFSSLDRSSRTEFRMMLAKQFASLEIPRLIVTHDDLDISSLCTREIVVRREPGKPATAR
jgi:molybdate transport system ATP-binding protein